MEKLFESISSYNFLNLLLPGAVFSFFIPVFFGIDILPNDIFGKLVISYFTGLVLSRVGSLCLEWPLGKFGILNASNYNKYVEAKQKDRSIDILLETCNMYRTFSAGAIILFISVIYYSKIGFVSEKSLLIMTVFAILLASFVKQHRVISKRVDAVNTLNNQS